jgi:hypothetical protein
MERMVTITVRAQFFRQLPYIVAKNVVSVFRILFYSSFSAYYFIYLFIIYLSSYILTNFYATFLLFYICVFFITSFTSLYLSATIWIWILLIFFCYNISFLVKYFPDVYFVLVFFFTSLQRICNKNISIAF